MEFDWKEIEIGQKVIVENIFGRDEMGTIERKENRGKLVIISFSDGTKGTYQKKYIRYILR